MAEIFTGLLGLLTLVIVWSFGYRSGSYRTLDQSEAYARAQQKVATEYDQQLERQKAQLQAARNNAQQLSQRLRQLEAAGAGRNTTPVSVDDFPDKDLPLSFVIGFAEEDAVQVCLSFTEFCHLVVAGQTGSGKSVFLFSMLVQILSRHSPDEVRVMLMDYKHGISFGRFDPLPHMLRPTITDEHEGVLAIIDVFNEMNRRIVKFREAGYENIRQYNADAAARNKLPLWLVVIDETRIMFKGKQQYAAERIPGKPEDFTLADMVDLLLEQARAAGIHLCACTQMPSATSVPSALRSQSAKIVFRLDNLHNTNSVLPSRRNLLGPDQLQGQGDGIFRHGNHHVRFQGLMIATQEVDEQIARICAEYPERLPSQPAHQVENVVDLLPGRVKTA